MNLFRLAVVLIPLVAALFVTGDAAACKVPTLRYDAACLKSSPTPAQFNLCQETLQHAPDSAPATVYAIVAAKAANQSYEATIAEGESELPSSSGDVLAVLRRCVLGTEAARGRMVNVIGDMSACDFRNTWQVYTDAEAAVKACTDLLAKFPLPAGSRVVAMNAADRDITTVARALGALAIFGTSQGS